MPTSSAPSLITVSPKGLYCRAGDFYIDPWQPVGRALITHAHSDHAREGSAIYHFAEPSRELIARRLGVEGVHEPYAYGERFTLGGVTISFHPAGHILGSAQVRLEYEGEVWVVSGDYKRDRDPTCAAFEVVPCDVLITEATFGLPVFRWRPIEEEAAAIHAWWMENRAAGRHSLLGCYALGKAQRVLSALMDFTDEPVITHGATEAMTNIYRDRGVPLIATRPLDDTPLEPGQLVLAPPAALSSTWSRRFGDFSSGFASGWMQIRGNRRRRGYDRGFVISDHADWPALLQTIQESQAKKVYVTHGYSEELARHLSEIGHDAEPLETLFEGETDA